jgi:mono/diheme cytochrome c family protein
MSLTSPTRRRRGLWVLCAILACWAAGCDLPGRPKLADQYVRPQDVASFSVLFQENCVGCHGADGKLGPAPPLNDKLFLALMPTSELHRVIAEGRAGTLMPPFAAASGGHLTVAQVKVLADGIKRRWGPVDSDSIKAPDLSLKAQQVGASRGDQQEGRKVFARACASCHGDNGLGGEHSGGANEAMAGAINDPDFLALISDQALRRIVITGRPDLGMPGYADAMGRPDGFKPLSNEDVANIVALLASWREPRLISRSGD